MQIKDEIIKYVKTRKSIPFMILGVTGIFVFYNASNEVINNLDMKLIWYLIFAILIYIGNFDA